MSQLLISAAHKSSGKTTISIGLCAAMHSRGMKVQPFKKGPDYIDPMWLGLASGRSCHNLDFYLMSGDEIIDTYAHYGADSNICLTEGNKGLYDGLDLDGSNSNAALATLLHTPVILVIDARGMTRGIAPLILGYQNFDQEVNIAGVILNQLGGSRHESKLRAVIEHYTDVPVVGAVHRDPALQILERHMGLMPSNEHSEATRQIGYIGAAIKAQTDLDRLLEIASTSTRPEPSAKETACHPHVTDVRVGIARDAAFGFYYPGDIEALQNAGAELVSIDTLHDSQLPDIDGLFIGGGFPESRMSALEANSKLRNAIRDAVEAGLPVYAECGGLMYLSRSISWKGNTCHMVGAIPGDITMHERPQGRGYVRVSETGQGPWPLCDEDGTPSVLHAHEFHYSSLDNLDPSYEHSYAFDVLRGTGIDGKRDGIVHRNMLACYIHQRNVGSNRWAERFIGYVRKYRNAP